MDETLERIKRELKVVCVKYKFNMPDFDDLFKPVFTSEEIWASNLVCSRRLQKLMKEYSYEELDKILKKQLSRVQSGKIQSGVYLSAKDLLEAKLVISRLLNTGNNSNVATFMRNSILKAYLQEFLSKIYKYNLKDSIPYITPKGMFGSASWTRIIAVSILIHEGIHAILEKNGIYFGVNALDEGLCVYFHRNYMGWFGIFFYRGGPTSKQYKKWAKYFTRFFKERAVDPADASDYLRKKIKVYGREKYRHILIDGMRRDMGKDFESKDLSFEDYNVPTKQ